MYFSAEAANADLERDRFISGSDDRKGKTTHESVAVNNRAHQSGLLRPAC
jgi:hypothetical protein